MDKQEKSSKESVDCLLNQTPLSKYILGLDLGIASVGWALVSVDDEENPIGLLDCGVRTFERAEIAKTGDSLAKARREARSVRRLIRRRAHRLLRLRRLLKREGVLTEENFSDGLLVNMPSEPWLLRVQGLEQKLNAKEWAAVLLHMVKHRGYLSQRKNEMNEAEKTSELGRLLSGVAENHKLLLNNATKYRTPAELAVKLFNLNGGHLRNKGGDYSHTFNRLDLQAELHLLFAKQREFGNPFATVELESKVDELLMKQRSALNGEDILKMLGYCTFEGKGHHKAAKNTYSAERFVWLTKLNNLRILMDGEERALGEDERKILLDEPYKKAKLTYAQVRKLLNMPDDSIFKGLRYGNESDGLKAESNTLMEMKSYHKIRQVLEKVGLKTEWQGLAVQPEKLDAIGTAFSLYKTDDDIKAALVEYNLPNNILDALLSGINFDQFIQLSLKALGKILPLMENGMRYDEASSQIYGSHHGTQTQITNLFLPNIPIDEVRNPVVFRTLTQARKVINAIIRKYGSPQRIHIETARELGKSPKDRKVIEKYQEENRKEREHAVVRFKEQFPFFIGEPKGQDILKMRLYEQQHCKCLYSGKEIDIGRLNEKGYVEIDHALPFSRTWDDSFNNKVLVFGSENQQKRNKTPYEYLGGAESSERWREFLARLQGCHFSHAKKQRLQIMKLDSKAEQGFLERNLNDTRYIARFLCNFIENNLHLEGDGKRPVFASNGQITALLRSLWGLRKVREESDRHHALDAVVVACSTVSMQQKITRSIQRRESLERIDTETGEVKQRIPQPWDFFRQEVMIRIFSDDPCKELAEKLNSRPQSLHECVTPLFVSRAPNRKMTGQGHLETIRSAKCLSEGISIVKKPLSVLKSKDIVNIVGYPHREPVLYEALLDRLAIYKDDPAKAFKEPFYKPNKDGSQGAVIKTLRIQETQKSGVMVRGGNGIADNATMVRVDVFEKAGKNYLVPVYAWQVAKGIVPNRAVVQGKDEKDWDEIDEHYLFKFSLYPSSNDLVEVMTQNGRIFGYFIGFDRSNARVKIKTHDSSEIYRVASKTALSFKKYQVDLLGKEICLSKSEKYPVLRMKNK